MNHESAFPPAALRRALLLLLTVVGLVSPVSGRERADTESRPARVPWTSSRVRGVPEPPPPYRAEAAYPRLRFRQPLTLTMAPGSSRWFVVQAYGRVLSFPASAGCEPPDLLIDLKAVFPNLNQAYGLAFHPDYPRTPYVYICCILNEENGSTIARFTVDPVEPPRARPESVHAVYRWQAGGHNGCSLKFGPDGFLYISTGDGTGPNPPDRLRAGQDLSNPLSAILRIDVDHPADGRSYGIPSDNPFIGVEGARPEIWAYGFRNVWKMSFDRLTGDLWAGDVGWDTWELIFRVQRGGNYGWSIMEGSQPVHPAEKRGPTPILPPVTEHDHSEARSITGGFVYRGRLYPDLYGAYVYGDYSTGKIWALWSENGVATRRIEVANTPYQIVAWGEAQDGELYFLDYSRTHEIYRLVPNDVRDESKAFPRLLSETGLFESVAKQRPAPGVIPYTVNAPYFSEGRVAERFLAIPGSGRIGGVLGGAWQFPPDTVAVRTVSSPAPERRPGRRLETQILHLHGTTWNPYTYVWNEAQDDARLAPAEGVLEGSSEDVVNRSPRVPSRSECKMCHTRKLGSLLGLNLLQSHVVRVGPADGAGTAGGDVKRPSQLEEWYSLGLLEERPSAAVLDTKVLVDPYGSGDVGHRARSYLHTNCSHCHRPGGGGNSSIRLTFDVSLENTGAIDQRSTQGDFELPGGRIVAPGRPYDSVLFYRLCKSGPGRMPHIGSRRVDRDGLQLIHDWIAALDRDGAAEGASVAAGQPANLDSALATTSGALEVAWRLRSGELESELQQSLLRSAREQPPQVRDLFETFLPEEERTVRLGVTFDEDMVLGLAGDVSRGRTVYWYTAGMRCQSCHRVEQQGGEIGPDLSAVGTRYDRLALLRSLTRPSETVPDAYRAYTAVTKSGQLQTGRLIGRDEGSVRLLAADGKVIELRVADVLELRVAEKSLMPEALLQSLTAQQAADLIAYLGSLRGGSGAKSD